MGRGQYVGPPPGLGSEAGLGEPGSFCTRDSFSFTQEHGSATLGVGTSWGRGRQQKPQAGAEKQTPVRKQPWALLFPEAVTVAKQIT